MGSAYYKNKHKNKIEAIISQRYSPEHERLLLSMSELIYIANFKIGEMYSVIEIGNIFSTFL